MSRDMLREIAQGALDAIGQTGLVVIKWEELLLVIIVNIALGIMIGMGVR